MASATPGSDFFADKAKSTKRKGTLVFNSSPDRGGCDAVGSLSEKDPDCEDLRDSSSKPSRRSRWERLSD